MTPCGTDGQRRRTIEVRATQPLSWNAEFRKNSHFQKLSSNFFIVVDCCCRAGTKSYQKKRSGVVAEENYFYPLTHQLQVGLPVW